MTTTQILHDTSAEEDRFRYHDANPQKTRGPTPRLVPWPPPPEPAPPEALTRPASKHPATTHSFAWTLLDPLAGRFELQVAGESRPLARFTVGGLAFPSATLEVAEHRLLFTATGVGNRRVAITDATTGTAVAEFEWQRLGRHGTLRLVDGGHLRWRKTGGRRPFFTFTDRFGNLLLRLRPDGRGFGYGLNALLEPPVDVRSDLTLLPALGWFLLISSGTAAAPGPAAMP
jgi:hypothetical protein